MAPPSSSVSFPVEDLRREPLSQPPALAVTRFHHLTVDVEEYFQVSAFERRIPRAYWPRIESRVEESVDRILALMDEHGALGTFFILGWVADRHPAVVKRIADGGHEVASHGWDHRKVPSQTPEEFRHSVRRTKQVLEDLGGKPVTGFRAPSFSLCPGHEWALDVLVEEGYRYDSSLFPIRRPGYGYPDGARGPHWIHRPSGPLAEFPPATLRRCGVNLPAGGGAYLRFFPFHVIRAAVRELEALGGSATLYIHPWELDPDQPRFKLPFLTRIRHYQGLSRTERCLRRLMTEFDLRSISSTLACS